LGNFSIEKRGLPFILFLPMYEQAVNSKCHQANKSKYPMRLCKHNGFTYNLKFPNKYAVMESNKHSDCPSEKTTKSSVCSLLAISKFIGNIRSILTVYIYLLKEINKRSNHKIEMCVVVC
jgi:hypothetical protein